MRRRTKASDAVQARMEAKVDLARLGTPGEYPDLHEKLARELATEYQIAEEGIDYVSVSWPNQQRAQDYFNAHGFVATLDHMLKLRAERNAPSDNAEEGA